ncbi:MAG: DNA-deoxyinosine glycosylase [Gammaproteobacteria bacterium]|nr:DNA-deoxyinosine glycosylase [Gammaproteobacteria bacterium]
MTGFPPVVTADATVLVLGSMPGQASLDVAQYYAHPRNAFWPMIGQLFNVPPPLNYEERLMLIQKNRIALWDVMKNCKREGSLDSSIEQSSIVANNFADFFVAYPSIRHLFFNGAQAETAFKRHVVPMLRPESDNPLEMQRLPSTSPAHAALSFEQKLAQWQCVREVVEP